MSTTTMRNCLDCGRPVLKQHTDERKNKRKRCDECRRERSAGYTARRNAIKRGATIADLIYPSHVFKRDNWTCHICGGLILEDSRQANRMVFGEFDSLAPTLDHIIPINLGGQHTLDNVATAHHKCNQSKGDTTGRRTAKRTARAAKETPVPFRKCNLHGCGRPITRRGMCAPHAYREDTYGDPLVGSCCCGCGELVDVPVGNHGPTRLPNHSNRRKGLAPTAQEQLALSTRREPVSDHGRSIGLTDDCHIWIKKLDPSGYGVMRDTYTGRGMLAHRFAYILTHDENAVEEKVVDHLCRVRACVNVNHLEAVTNQENVVRGHAVNTPAPSWHERSHGHPFISDQTVAGTARQRRCLTCWEASQAQRATRTLCPAGLHAWPENKSGKYDCRECSRERNRAKHRAQHGHDFVVDESFTGKKARCLTCHIKRQEQRTHCPHGHSFAEHGTTTQGSCAECNRIRARKNQEKKRAARQGRGVKHAA